jgi:negative modulator of initiation of replication
MNSIEIDDQVLAELSSRATGFHATPNDVLRRLLNIGASSPASPKQATANGTPPAADALPSTLPEFIKSERFTRHHQAIDKFLAVLGWLHQAHPKQFADMVLAFRRGSRRYFAKSEREILQSGDGITAKPIPKSPFWVLTTLDNKSKRIVLEDLLRALAYARGDINMVLAALPDSGIRRSHARSRLLASL